MTSAPAATEQNNSTGKAKRRWYQFRLRTLLIFVLLLSTGLSWLGLLWFRPALGGAELVIGVVVSLGLVTVLSLGWSRGLKCLCCSKEGHIMKPEVSRILTVGLLLFVAMQGCRPGAQEVELGPPLPEVGRDEAVAEIEKLGGSFQSEPPGLGWEQGPIVEVHLEQTDATDSTLQHLKGLSNLQTLLLHGTHVTDAGLRNLREMPRLQRLFLDKTHISDIGLEHLKGLNTLVSLELNDTNVGDAGLEHVGRLTSLQSLGLAHTKITNSGLKNLKGLTSLLSLSLGGTTVGDAGLEHLKGMNALQWLSLPGTQVTDAGLRHLEGLTGLQTLSLVRTQVTDAGLKHLTRLASLRELYVSGTQVTEEGIKKFEEVFPNCTVHHH